MRVSEKFQTFQWALKQTEWIFSIGLGGCIATRDYFCSLVEIWDSFRGSSVKGGSLRTNSAVLLRYTITAQDNKGLSVSTWRKQGGDLAPHNHARLEDGGYYQVAGASVQWFGEG